MNKSRYDLRAHFLSEMRNGLATGDTLENIAHDLMEYVAEYHNEGLREFVEGTEQLADTYNTKANEEGISHFVQGYRDGKSDGLYAAATRANRMKI
jgi:ABC-type transporter Mla subunit MlaD